MRFTGCVFGRALERIVLKVDGKLYRFMGNTEKTWKTILAAGDEGGYQVSYTESEPSGN